MVLTEMTNEEAWEYASQWGSFIAAGDNGACMYGFNEKFQVQSEEHRQACIGYIENVCEPLVQSNPEHFDDDEMDRLDALKFKLKQAKCEA